MSTLGGGDRPNPREQTPQRRTPVSSSVATSVVEPAATPAERHIGDRLAALVDGELGHDARERVLSHLATCDQCRAEAEQQRSLKTVFAAAALLAPAPSAGLLARLQGLPALDKDDQGPFGGLGEFAAFDQGSVGDRPRGPLDASPPWLPLESGELSAEVAAPAQSGFRVHEFGRSGRPTHRGRRFAFAAAGAFSMAAIALGALPVDDISPSRAEDPGSATVPPSTSRPFGHTGLLSTSVGDVPAMLVPAVLVRQQMRGLPHGRPVPQSIRPGISPAPLVDPSGAAPGH